MQLSKPRVVIVGGGFGGLQAAKSMADTDLDVILIDRANHHVFQPLLYQVAMSALSPGDIGQPLRSELRNYKNIQVILNNVIKIDKTKRLIYFEDEDVLEFDYLILSPGARHSYFGHNDWERFAPGLKTLNDALIMREKILTTFEKAERNYYSPDAEKYRTFVVIGGGPTGVELAGSIAEISLKTMLPDFPLLKANDIRVVLIEAGNKLLPSFPDKLSTYTKSALEEMGVEVMLNKRVTNINADGVELGIDFIKSTCVIWGAGNEASPLLKSLDISLDNAGRALVNNDLTIPNYPNIFIIGDSAFLKDANGVNVPGVAQGAIQGAIYVAGIIENRKKNVSNLPFRYKDKGNMATIGRAKAVTQIGNWLSTGFVAWSLWAVLHIVFLINFRNRFKVIFEWLWYYFTFQPGARLIYYKEKQKKE